MHDRTGGTNIPGLSAVLVGPAPASLLGVPPPVTGAAPAGAAGSTRLPVTFRVPEHLQPWSGLGVRTSTLGIQGAGACAQQGHERRRRAPNSPQRPEKGSGAEPSRPGVGGCLGRRPRPAPGAGASCRRQTAFPPPSGVWPAAGSPPALSRWTVWLRTPLGVAGVGPWSPSAARVLGASSRLGAPGCCGRRWVRRREEGYVGVDRGAPGELGGL